MLDEWVDEIKEWLFQSLKHKIVGFLLITFAINSIVWGIIEPTNFNQCIKHYPLYHYLFITLISIFIYIKLLPNTIIKEFDLNADPNEFNKSNWNPMEDGCLIKEFNDRIYGESILFQGPAGASRFAFQGVESTAKHIRIRFCPHDNFLLQLQLAVLTRNGQPHDSIWLTFKDNIKTPKKESNNHWSIPIRYVIKFNLWMETTINLNKLTKQGLETDSFNFIKLCNIQVRGTGMINKITLY